MVTASASPVARSSRYNLILSGSRTSNSSSVISPEASASSIAAMRSIMGMVSSVIAKR